MLRPDGTLRRAGRIGVAALFVGGLLLTAGDPFTIAFYATYGAVGSFLTIRRPRNVVSWLLLIIAFGFIATSLPADVDIAALKRGQASSTTPCGPG